MAKELEGIPLLETKWLQVSLTRTEESERTASNGTHHIVLDRTSADLDRNEI